MRDKWKISERNRLLALSLVTGVGAGLASVLLVRLINLCQSLVARSVSGGSGGWLLFVLPGVGMLLSLLITKYLVKDNISHGVTKVLVAISRHEAKIKPHNTWSSLLTSSLTIGLGGSVGAEAPIVYTGAALGSQLGQRFGLSRRGITVLVGCGAAGAVAGIFKAPLAGVLFTLEILMFNISMTSMTPLLLSSLSATVVSYLLAGDIAPFACTPDAFSMGRMPFYLILGVFCGFCSLYFQKMTLSLEDWLSKLGNPFLRWGLCALGLGLLVMSFPPLYGEGYGSLAPLLGGEGAEAVPGISGLFTGKWGIVLFFAAVMLLKVFSMTLTNAGGGVGGTFGPTLFVGAMMGFVMSRSFNLGFALDLPEQNFVLVGMAGLMAGVMQAPMTAIFLIAEISGGYDLFLPLILCATISYGTTRIWEKYSIYTKRIAQSGELLTHDSDQATLAMMKVSDYVRDKYPRVRPQTGFKELMKIFSEDSSLVFAVVDASERFLGMIEVDNIHRYIAKPEEHDSLKARDIMERAPEIIHISDSMPDVVAKFEATGAWRIPVVDADGKYLGFMSRSRLLIAYRDELKSLTEE